MPELPEVETIRAQLAPHVEGRTIVRARIGDARFTRPEAPEVVEEALRGALVERLQRRGKYLSFVLSEDRHLLIHLRMTGALLYDADADHPHARSWFELDDGHRVAYVDPRRFGTAHLLRGDGARERYFADRLGVEPLTPEFTIEHLRRLARGVRAPVKPFILDQRRIAGVGNIYADEALHRAGVHPLREAGKLTTKQITSLHQGIEDALRAGIAAKGATIDDFRHVDGAYGSFQDQFRVHRREGEPCPVCGTTVRKLVVGGRGTYVCERCQVRPRRRGSTNHRSDGPGGPDRLADAR